jgi:hypothetical protein
MGTPKRPHLRTIKTGKVIKVGIKEGQPVPSLIYNKPTEAQAALIFKPKEVKKTK